MEQRKLGSQGLVVSAEGLGCMGMSEFYGPSDEDEAIATIHRALDLGITFLDTADMYGPFTNERLVGQAFAGRREQVVIATKFGNMRRDRRRWPRRQRQARVRARRLRRLTAAARRRRTSTCTTSTAWTRRCPSRRPSGAMAELVQRGQGALPRPLRGGAGHDPPRARRASDHRAADRVLAVDARAGGGDPRHRAASWASASWPTARWGAAFSTGRFRASEDLAGDLTSAGVTRASRGEPPEEPRAGRALHEIARRRA